MLRVLITGADSYIGTRLNEYLSAFLGAYEVAEMDLRGAWSAESFRGFDAVIHVAGIAHMRENADNRALYSAVNRDLALQAARAAKEQGVRQFVFFSSMSVYGLCSGRITAQTMPKPNTCYGISKWEAEQALTALADESFCVAVLRPPMIYGRGCKGNYPRLSKLIGKLPLWPCVENERSMLYIGCLCAFMHRLLQSGRGGLFFPQNKEYVSTNELAKQIARAHGKRLWQFKGLGRLISALCERVPTLAKLFGTLTYDQSMSSAFEDEPQPSFEQTIQETEAWA
ncbi:MAG: NAD-dependent epimerase/dehydratase family protein [Clostridia bacterium]